MCHETFLAAKAVMAKEYLLADIPSLKSISTSDIETVKARITKAAALSNLCPIFRPLKAESQSSTDQAMTCEMTSSADTSATDSTLDELKTMTATRLGCLLIGRLFNPEREMLEGLANPVKDNQLLLSFGGVLAGFLSCDIEHPEELEKQATIQFTVTFRSFDERLSARCVSSFLFCLNEILIGRLADL